MVDDLVKYQNNHNNFIAKNATESSTKGLELDISYKDDGFMAYANLSYQKTDIDPDSSFQLENRRHGELFPEISANLGASYQLQDHGWRISLNNQYVGKRPASSTNVLEAEAFYDADDYLNSTLTLQRTFSLFNSKETRVAFKVDDLWNEKFAYPGFGGIDIPSLGRTFSIIIEQRF